VIEVRIRDAVGLDLNNKTNEMVLSQFGHQEAAGESYKVLSYHSPNIYAYIYGIKNEGELPLEVTLDFSASENVSLSTKSPLVRKVVKPGEVQFMTNVQAGFGNYNKVFKHSVKSPLGVK
jgi:hypothetical protein